MTLSPRGLPLDDPRDTSTPEATFEQLDAVIAEIARPVRDFYLFSAGQ